MVRQRHVGIEAAKNLENIRGAEGEADPRDILDEFLRVDADDFASRVQQRPAAIARIDGRVRLDFTFPDLPQSELTV